ncbi:unnamed protein product [Owenia fusiformis]|uniref:glycerophosphocholine cholinephosphodiesterase n=1 Tax=Owenia fusiformis TaxID=6347 RepID=A0A8S4PHY7_OWEFU|nr:unnamed protein product [Owenia fusiformis]
MINGAIPLYPKRWTRHPTRQFYYATRREMLCKGPLGVRDQAMLPERSTNNITQQGDGRNPALVTILLDGYRYDYLEKAKELDLTGFGAILDNGVKADYLIPTYPTESYPNYYSLMTGLYCESHGMIGNYMYDEIHNTSFLIGTNPEQNASYFWDDGDPLWITAKRQGLKSVMHYWPGCEVEIRGLRPDYCAPYNGVPNKTMMEIAIDRTVEELSNGVAYAGIYYEASDKKGHIYGPDSPVILNVTREVDDLLLQLHNKLEDNNLIDSTNIMIFSDHGMVAIDPLQRVLNVSVNMENIERSFKSSIYSQIWPKENMTSKVYDELIALKDTLGHFNVYLKADLPERWHLKNHYRVAPIVLLPDEGYIIQLPDAKVNTNLGGHGYDNNVRDMRATFIISGPGVKKKSTHKAISAVELYQLMCHILNIDASPHNGTWANVKGMLTQASGAHTFLFCNTMTLTMIIWTTMEFLYHYL